MSTDTTKQSKAQVWQYTAVICPLVVTIISFMKFPSMQQIWGGFFLATIISFILLSLPKRFFQVLAMMVIILASGTAVGYLVLDSILKGIELVSGKQEGMFLGTFPEQIGMINLPNMVASGIILILAVISVQTVILYRRTLQNIPKQKSENVNVHTM